MCNRNATASWSGYSHQGQVGLLVALKKMQEQNTNLATHFVQFETHEDVAIYEEGVGGAKTYLSVHQVKAYYSGTNMYKSTFSGVLNGTFEDGNIKYLHTAAEITDWTTSTTTNNNGVLLYPYTATQNYCGTTEIETHIRAELNVLLNNNVSLVNTAYQRLTFELDHKIRLEHQKAHKNLFDIKFSLAEIDGFVRSTEDFQKKEIYDCRKLFYESFIEIIKEEDINDDRRDIITNNIIKQINTLSDEHFLLFLQRLNLNETAENLKRTQVYYNRTGLKQVFFRMLIDVESINPDLLENSVKYKTPTDSSNYIITAIMEEDRNKQTVVENIINNLKSQNLLWENHALVNRHINGKLIDLNPKINEILVGEEKDKEHKKFMSFTQQTKLIDRDQAKQNIDNGANP